MTPTALQHAPYYAAVAVAAAGRGRPARVVAAAPHDRLDPQRLRRRRDRDRRRRRRAVPARQGRAAGDGRADELRDRGRCRRASLAPVRPRRRRGAPHARARSPLAVAAGADASRRRAGVPHHAGSAGPRTSMARQRDLRPAHDRPRRPAGPAALRTPRLRRRRHGLGQDDIRAAVGRRPHGEGQRGAVLRRPEGRPRRRGVPAAPRGRDRPPVHPHRPQGRGHRPLAAAVGRPAGRSRRQGPRRDRDERAVLRRHAQTARRDRRQRPARRGLLAALVPAA